MRPLPHLERRRLGAISTPLAAAPSSAISLAINALGDFTDLSPSSLPSWRPCRRRRRPLHVEIHHGGTLQVPTESNTHPHRPSHPHHTGLPSDGAHPHSDPPNSPSPSRALGHPSHSPPSHPTPCLPLPYTYNIHDVNIPHPHPTLCSHPTPALTGSPVGLFGVALGLRINSRTRREGVVRVEAEKPLGLAFRREPRGQGQRGEKSEAIMRIRLPFCMGEGNQGGQCGGGGDGKMLKIV